jgi:hypothetical protein
MLQTEIWRSARAAPPNVGLPIWWQRHRAVLLPQIILVLGVLALWCGALWTVGQYTHHKAALQVAETNRLLGQFRSGPVAASWARLRAAWQAEGARQDALLAQLSSLTGSEHARIRHEHRQLVLQIIEEHELQDDIEMVRGFVIRLATCVRIGSCDRDILAAQVGPALWAFRDQHIHYFELEHSESDLDSYLESIAPRPAASQLNPPGSQS